MIREAWMEERRWSGREIAPSCLESRALCSIYDSERIVGEGEEMSMFRERTVARAGAPDTAILVFRCKA